MNVWTKRGADIVAPTDAAGNPRKVVNGEMQTWMTEVERLFKAGAFNSVDAVGLYADRSTYDSEAEGFVYLSIDGDGAGSSSAVVFIKESAASGDWSPPVPFQGDKGWSPLFRAANDDARRVVEVYDWVGGEGEKPAQTGYIGASGLTANIAEAVDIRGPQGVSGSGLSWSFDAGTSDEDPGAGNLRANAGDLSAATELFVSKVSAGGDPVASFLAGLTNSTSTHKGYLILTEPSSGAQATYDVTGTTDAAGYVKIAVSGHSGAATLTDAALLSVVFSRTGNAGDLNGVNPGAVGLAVLEAETKEEARTAIGVDEIIAVPVPDRTALKALDTTAFGSAILKEVGREGTFHWRSGEYSSEVAGDTLEAIYIKADAVASTSGAWVRSFQSEVLASWWGVNSGSADNATALNAAASFAMTNDIRLDMRGLGELATQSTVLFENCDVVGTGTTIRPTSGVAYGVQFGDASNVYEKRAVDIACEGQGKGSHGSSAAAILYRNAIRATFENVTGGKFSRGYLFEPLSGMAVGYCTWINPYCHRANQSIRMRTTASAAYVADNKFFGGRLQMTSVDEAEYHIYAQRDSGMGSLSNNHFYGTSMESRVGASAAVKAAVNLIQADAWILDGIRTEGDWNLADIQFSSTTTKCIVRMPYEDGSVTIVDNNPIGDNIAQVGHTIYQGGVEMIQFENGSLALNGINANTTGNAANVYVDSSTGNTARSTSAAKFKTDIQAITDEALDAFLKMDGVTYKSLATADDPKQRFVGMVADQAHSLGLHDLVSYDAHGEVENFNYTRATAYLLELFKRRLADGEKV